MSELVQYQPAAISTTVPDAEFNTIWRQAEVLARSAMVPEAYRSKVHPQTGQVLVDGAPNIVVAALTGRSFGLDALTAMRAITVIKGQPTLKPEFMLALIRKAGHKVVGDTSNTGAWAEGTRTDGTTMRVEFTQEMAKQAGLLGGGAWKTYPDAMYWARAVSKLGRMLFPDVLLGASYTAEELSSGVDLNEPVKATAVVEQPAPVAAAPVVEVPAGYELRGAAVQRLIDACGGEQNTAGALWVANGLPGRDVKVVKTADVDKLIAEVTEPAVEGEVVDEAAAKRAEVDAEVAAINGEVAA